ncbi:alpha-N-acetylgalactosaminide alpha-2,6-sialyltransferase 3 isoform X1 [Physeter macrocephalus]|uniref:alpha-N-acetylneuraminyl-2,3-beta-galactosyl-1,3-N-acetylgalactosaminide6-alpha-sialyltransferase n=2 Tax=Artiodactyla TaxID=91561 RepID=A0A2Y9SGC0_PHYMC|nr:alpha-N-acetylgalactosaminide alpha-2,6-sialyltransferase 3 isoform X1 [Physeter catodon]|eukprot:XP_023975335.2 alpha-N-acetylgalactosaminide alpha-2,6-sialyltransferase 3 isoform X1 [Physeter catodon]
MACILKRKSVIAVSFIAAFLFLLAVRLVNEVNFPLLLNCFGQPGAKWIPFSYTYRRPLRTHYGYINVRTQETFTDTRLKSAAPPTSNLLIHWLHVELRKQLHVFLVPLQLDCNLCAIVSNSGQMVGQKVGNEIDQSSCIWRMNNAPTKGYEEDVGRMTMIRVVSHTSVPLLLKNPDYFFKEANATIYVIWGPFRNMRKDGNGIVYNMLKKTVDIYPNAQIYVTTEKRMSYCDGVFKKETGKDRVQSGSYLSTGWFTFILAMDACYGIHVYGMINDTYCKTEGYRKVPYHYYEQGRDECDEYFLHEHAPYGGHRFITEKKVFAKWAKKHRIIFTHPNWTVS